MGEQIFAKIRKQLAILLAVCFLVSVTAATATASNADDYEKGLKAGKAAGYIAGKEYRGSGQKSNSQPNPEPSQIKNKAIQELGQLSCEICYNQGFARGFTLGFEAA